MTTFGFIGTGHMGSMLVHKFMETGAIAGRDIIASNRSREKAERLAKETGIRVGDNREVTEQSNIILIGVRPMDMKGVLLEVQDLLTPEKLLVSVAVDFSLKDIQAICSARAARVIPSITSGQLKGVALVAFGNNITTMDRDQIACLFKAIGDMVEVEENDFEVLADLTSCAPGYISAILREFVLAARRRGITAELAERLVKETLAGTAELLSRESFQGIISCVATHGGINAEGVKVIQSEAPMVFDHLFEATNARHKRVKRQIKDQF